VWPDEDTMRQCENDFGEFPRRFSGENDNHRRIAVMSINCKVLHLRMIESIGFLACAATTLRG